MKTFQPWTIDGNTLQLTRWTDHGPGSVLVDVDVFEAFIGRVFDSRGRERRCDLLGADGFAGTCSVPISDLQSDLFRHIDAHPQTHFILRTRHPERVRECWPMRDDLGAANFPEHCNKHPDRRGNVTLQIGPIHTQADADRLLPESYVIRDLVAGVDWFFRPTERIDLMAVDELVETTNPGVYSNTSGRWIGRQWTFPVGRIVVSGGDQPLHPDWVRCLRDQAVQAGIEFVFASWGDWMPFENRPGKKELDVVYGEFHDADELGFIEACMCEAGTQGMYRVGKKAAGRMLDGREWGQFPEVS